jgi:fructose-1,6-bisphosphatase/inositol monophosphatase family enzyme
MNQTANLSALLLPIQTLHNEIRDAVVAAAERQQDMELAEVDREEAEDTIYTIDVISERVLDRFFTEIGRHHCFIAIAEGMPQGRKVYPADALEADAAFRIIVDPIDGTRGIMYQKRSAWILTGVAPNRGPATSLRDVVLALQTEIPLVKQHLSDAAWAVKGEGVGAERFDRLTGEAHPLRLRPSGAPTIAHGFAMVSRFFPGAREELAAIDEEIVRGALGPVREGKAHCFEDQYICTGGQLYELMAGHDRFVADLRPLMERSLAARGLRLGICCHPYDLATELVAREAGVIVTDPAGAPLDAPLAVEPEVAWVGYANASVRAQVEPLLQAALRSRGLLPERS